jgi:hypothetical protein
MAATKLIRPNLKRGDQYPLRFGNGPSAKQGNLVTVVKVRKDRHCATGFRVYCVNAVTGKGLQLDSSYLLPHPNDGTGEIARLQANHRIESVTFNQDIFDFFARNHNLTLTESEIHDIELFFAARQKASNLLDLLRRALPFVRDGQLAGYGVIPGCSTRVPFQDRYHVTKELEDALGSSPAKTPAHQTP